MAELVPEGAWDTDTYAYAAKRSYTPKPAHIEEYPSHLTGCKKIVIVQASMQGTTPEPLIDALNKQHNEVQHLTLRGLATITLEVIQKWSLDELKTSGIVGARFHKMSWGHGSQSGGADILNEIKAIAAVAAPAGWVLSIFCPISAWAYMANDIRQMDSRIRIVADHFGGTFPGEEKSEDFQTFLGLIRDKKVYVKISGFERLYHGHPEGMKAIEPVARAVIEAGPDQIIYGSDWPHTQLGVTRQGKTDEKRLNEVEGFRDVPDAEHIRTLREWIPNDEVWRKLFVTNAEKLFGNGGS